MFTGIVERRGSVAALRDRSGGREITVEPLNGGNEPPWEPAVLGESIAVSGVCLSAVKLGTGGRPLTFDVVPETLARTTLGRLRSGDAVNLERSLRVGDRLSGHFVTGHVDGVGEVLSREKQGDQVLFRIGCTAELIGLLISKGSVAIDGISLTVIDVGRTGRWFSFAAIPHTLAVTTLGEKRAGEAVNLETDALGKWVLHGVREVLDHQAPGRKE